MLLKNRYTDKYMVNWLKLHKKILSVIVIAVVMLFVFGTDQVLMLRKAHSTFANYYNFRGCKQLLTKTPTYGVCKTASGTTVTIVQYKGKWYLKADLPIGLWGHLN